MIGRVTRLTWRGHGVVQLEATHYLPGVLPGEQVAFEAQPEARLARLVGVLEAAPEREDPACDQAAGCPGCPLRHVAVERHRIIKQRQHEATLKRLAALDATVSIVGHAPRDGYRARARARPFQAADRVVLGLGAHPGHPPVDLTACPAQTEGSRALLRRAHALVEAVGAPWAHAQDAPGVLGVEVEGTPEDGRISLLLSDARWDAAFAAAAGAWSGVHLTRRCMRPRGPGPIVGLCGPGTTRWTCEADAFVASHPAWRPHSPQSLPQLRAAVLEALGATADDAVLEIGCGVGTLSLPIARRARSILGIDISRQAVQDATANAARAGLSNAVFQVGEGAKVIRRLLKRGRRFDRVVIHMMRRPLGGAALRATRLLGAHRLIYIAPSVASLARDLAERGPWHVDDFRAIDQLPGTVHLLTIARLSTPDQSAQS